MTFKIFEILLGLPPDDLKQETETGAYTLQSDPTEAAEAILQISFMYNLSASDVRNPNSWCALE